MINVYRFYNFWKIQLDSPPNWYSTVSLNNIVSDIVSKNVLITHLAYFYHVCASVIVERFRSTIVLFLNFLFKLSKMLERTWNLIYSLFQIFTVIMIDSCFINKCWKNTQYSIHHSFYCPFIILCYLQTIGL